MGIPAVLRDFGVDPDLAITAAGLSSDLFTDPENRIPAPALGHLIALCVQLTKCDHFGLLVGQKGGLSSLGRVGFVALNSPDVGTALASLASYMPYHDRAACVTLTTDGSLASLGYAIFHHMDAQDQIVDGALAIGVVIMRTLCGDQWRATEVTFAHRKPANIEPYNQFFRCALRFDMEQSALVFATRWLSRPLPNADPALRTLLLREMEPVAASRPLDVAADVRGVVRTLLGKGRCKSDIVAQLFAVNERTLRRQLVAEGTTFKALLDEVRYAVAQQFLRDSALPLERIAGLLDYSELSAFSRAFVRWSGMSPSDWRRTYTANADTPDPHCPRG